MAHGSAPCACCELLIFPLLPPPDKSGGACPLGLQAMVVHVVALSTHSHRRGAVVASARTFDGGNFPPFSQDDGLDVELAIEFTGLLGCFEGSHGCRPGTHPLPARACQRSADLIRGLAEIANAGDGVRGHSTPVLGS
eukprot:scaffold827_cov369-Prasinococcus_capsulatus_cf.AAC.10